jgi:hypothetical protein
VGGGTSINFGSGDGGWGCPLDPTIISRCSKVPNPSLINNGFGSKDEGAWGHMPLKKPNIFFGGKGDSRVKITIYLKPWP